MLNALKLYYRPGACALAPHIVLIWIGAEYETINAPRDESFKNINPSGAVPALEFPDGRVITQCGAILHFLAEAAGRDDLLGGSTTRERAETSKWTSFFTGDFHPAFFPFFVPHRYTTDDSDDALDHVKGAAITLIRDGLNTIEAQLSSTPNFIGDQYTIADAYSVPMLRWANGLFGDKLSEWPSTDNYYSSITKDIGVKQAMSTQGIAP